MLAGIICFWFLLCSFCFNFFFLGGGKGVWGGGCCGRVVFMGEHLDDII